MELLDLNSGLVIIERAECFDLLAREEVGRLAVVVGGRPEIFPVNYVVEGDGVVFRTDPGTKLAGAVRGPVAFEVDHLDRATRSAWSVILHGHAHQVTAFDSPDLRDRTAHLALRPWTVTAKAHLVRIDPTSVTGRWIKGRGQPTPDHPTRKISDLG
jgi:nitroimidazol reductase NimA-like FMN-containing flavoprotein (pyridoxamine 5'-phosphate oxidase superfamily)